MHTPLQRFPMKGLWQISSGLTPTPTKRSLPSLLGPFSPTLPSRFILTFLPLSSGAGYTFGAQVVRKFLEVNSMVHILRAHQLCMEGFSVLYDDRLSTVWSAPNYCYRCGNMASILEIGPGGEKHFNVFDAAPENDRDGPGQQPLPQAVPQTVSCLRVGCRWLGTDGVFLSGRSSTFCSGAGDDTHDTPSEIPTSNTKHPLPLLASLVPACFLSACCSALLCALPFCRHPRQPPPLHPRAHLLLFPDRS